jgi:excisionase family DNA binding protein
MQAVEIVRSRGTPDVGNSQRFAPILDDLLTTFLQGFMTVPEVAKRLGVCRSTVYQLCERGELRHLRVSNAIRVPVRALAEYIRRSRSGQKGTTRSPGTRGKLLMSRVTTS